MSKVSNGPKSRQQAIQNWSEKTNKHATHNQRETAKAAQQVTDRREKIDAKGSSREKLTQAVKNNQSASVVKDAKDHYRSDLKELSNLEKNFWGKKVTEDKSWVQSEHGKGKSAEASKARETLSQDRKQLNDYEKNSEKKVEAGKIDDLVNNAGKTQGKGVESPKDHKQKGFSLPHTAKPVARSDSRLDNAKKAIQATRAKKPSTAENSSTAGPNQAAAIKPKGGLAPQPKLEENKPLIPEKNIQQNPSNSIRGGFHLHKD